MMNIIYEEDLAPRPAVEPVKPTGWTKDDKYNLYQALKACGSSDIDKITPLLPQKSRAEIRKMLDYFKEKALKHPVTQSKRKKRVINTLSRVPLAIWAKFLSDSLNYTELQTETANALRLIAECEYIPTPLSTCNIDFRQIYNTIANAMEGKSLLDDPNIDHIIETCIIETAYTSKSFILNSSLKYLIDSVDLDEKAVTVFPRPTDNHELSTLRHLASQRNYNPLSITEAFLRPSVHGNK